MTEKRKDAKRLAQHYFSMIALKAGVGWDSDNNVEIDNLIDLIIDAAKDEIEKETRNTRYITIWIQELAQTHEFEADEWTNRIIDRFSITHEEASKHLRYWLESSQWQWFSDDPDPDEM